MKHARGEPDLLSMAKRAASGRREDISNYLSLAVERKEAMGAGSCFSGARSGRRRPVGVERLPDGSVRLGEQIVGTVHCVSGGYEIAIPGTPAIRLSSEYAAMDLAARIMRRER